MNEAEMRTIDPEAAEYADWAETVDMESLKEVWKMFKEDTGTDISFSDFRILWWRQEVKGIKPKIRRKYPPM